MHRLELLLGEDGTKPCRFVLDGVELSRVKAVRIDASVDGFTEVTLTLVGVEVCGAVVASVRPEVSLDHLGPRG